MQPSHPSIRLWDDSRAPWSPATRRWPLRVQYTPKARVFSGDVTALLRRASAAAAGLFPGGRLVGRREHRAYEAKRGSDRVGQPLLSAGHRRQDVIARHFDELTQMVTQPIYYRLDYPRRYDELPRVREAILRHAVEARKPNDMNLSDKVTIPTQVMARQVGDETVILDLASGTYYGLDPVGARIWQLMAEGQSLAQVCDGMLAEYEVSRDDIERDVLALVQALLDKQLVSIGV